MIVAGLRPFFGLSEIHGGAFVSAVPSAVTALGGRQSARTLHFLVFVSLVLFLLVHVAMVWLAGFSDRVVAMITGRARIREEHQ